MSESKVNGKVDLPNACVVSALAEGEPDLDVNNRGALLKASDLIRLPQAFRPLTTLSTGPLMPYKALLFEACRSLLRP